MSCVGTVVTSPQDHWMIKGRTEGRAERNTGIWKKIGIWINEKIENQKRYELNEILGTEIEEKKTNLRKK